MATNFPTSLDSLTNPQPTDTLSSPSHAGQHTDANDAIEALEAKVGVNSSAVTTSHDYKIAQLETNSISKTITAAKGDIIVATANDVVARQGIGANNTILTADSTLTNGLKWTSTITNPTISSGTISGSLINSLEEKWDSTTLGATGTYNFDLLTRTAYSYLGSATGNITINFRGNSSTTLDSLLSSGQSISCLFTSKNGATPYSLAGVNIDGAAATVRWLGGSPPTGGTANLHDFYYFTIHKDSGAITVVYASMLAFG